MSLGKQAKVLTKHQQNAVFAYIKTFITTCAKKISTVGGSIRDVQTLARHSSLQMTQRYIDADVDAQKKVVNMV